MEEKQSFANSTENSHVMECAVEEKKAVPPVESTLMPTIRLENLTSKYEVAELVFRTVGQFELPGKPELSSSNWRIPNREYWLTAADPFVSKIAQLIYELADDYLSADATLFAFLTKSMSVFPNYEVRKFVMIEAAYFCKSLVILSRSPDLPVIVSNRMNYFLSLADRIEVSRVKPCLKSSLNLIVTKLQELKGHLDGMTSDVSARMQTLHVTLKALSLRLYDYVFRVSVNVKPGYFSALPEQQLIFEQDKKASVYFQFRNLYFACLTNERSTDSVTEDVTSHSLVAERCTETQYVFHPSTETFMKAVMSNGIPEKRAIEEYAAICNLRFDSSSSDPFAWSNICGTPASKLLFSSKKFCDCFPESGSVSKQYMQFRQAHRFPMTIHVFANLVSAFAQHISLNGHGCGPKNAHLTLFNSLQEQLRLALISYSNLDSLSLKNYHMLSQKHTALSWNASGCMQEIRGIYNDVNGLLHLAMKTTADLMLEVQNQSHTENLQRNNIILSRISLYGTLLKDMNFLCLTSQVPLPNSMDRSQSSPHLPLGTPLRIQGAPKKSNWKKCATFVLDGAALSLSLKNDRISASKLRRSFEMTARDPLIQNLTLVTDSCSPSEASKVRLIFPELAGFAVHADLAGVYHIVLAYPDERSYLRSVLFRTFWQLTAYADSEEPVADMTADQFAPYGTQKGKFWISATNDKWFVLQTEMEQPSDGGLEISADGMKILWIVFRQSKSMDWGSCTIEDFPAAMFCRLAADVHLVYIIGRHFASVPAEKLRSTILLYQPQLLSKTEVITFFPMSIVKDTKSSKLPLLVSYVTDDQKSCKENNAHQDFLDFMHDIRFRSPSPTENDGIRQYFTRRHACIPLKPYRGIQEWQLKYQPCLTSATLVYNSQHDFSLHITGKHLWLIDSITMKSNRLRDESALFQHVGYLPLANGVNLVGEMAWTVYSSMSANAIANLNPGFKFTLQATFNTMQSGGRISELNDFGEHAWPSVQVDTTFLETDKIPGSNYDNMYTYTLLRRYLLCQLLQQITGVSAECVEDYRISKVESLNDETWLSTFEKFKERIRYLEQEVAFERRDYKATAVIACSMATASVVVLAHAVAPIIFLCSLPPATLFFGVGAKGLFHDARTLSPFFRKKLEFILPLLSEESKEVEPEYSLFEAEHKLTEQYRILQNCGCFISSAACQEKSKCGKHQSCKLHEYTGSTQDFCVRFLDAVVNVVHPMRLSLRSLRVFYLTVLDDTSISNKKKDKSERNRHLEITQTKLQAPNQSSSNSPIHIPVILVRGLQTGDTDATDFIEISHVLICPATLSIPLPNHTLNILVSHRGRNLVSDSANVVFVCDEREAFEVASVHLWAKQKGNHRSSS